MKDKIIFISTPSCGRCKALKSQIPQGISIECWDATEHKDFCEEAGIVSVPALIVNGNIIKDYVSIVKFIKNL